MKQNLNLKGFHRREPSVRRRCSSNRAAVRAVEAAVEWAFVRSYKNQLNCWAAGLARRHSQRR